MNEKVVAELLGVLSDLGYQTAIESYILENESSALSTPWLVHKQDLTAVQRMESTMESESEGSRRTSQAKERKNSLPSLPGTSFIKDMAAFAVKSILVRGMSGQNNASEDQMTVSGQFALAATSCALLEALCAKAIDPFLRTPSTQEGDSLPRSEAMYISPFLTLYSSESLSRIVTRNYFIHSSQFSRQLRRRAISRHGELP